MFSFQKLQVWQKSLKLYEEINKLIKNQNMKGDYDLKDQIKRSSLSISTNIAEGVGREKTKEKKQFMNIAKGSLYETVSLLIILKNNGYCSERTFNEMFLLCEEISKMLYTIIKSKNFI